jgi:hypothetical protein
MKVEHWSASRFQTWDVCPVVYKERYVDGVATPPSVPLLFGKAMHRALEHHFKGEDGDRSIKLAVSDYGLDPRLVAVGLFLLDEVDKLGLDGYAEMPFELHTDPWWGAPTIGFIDLVNPEAGIVYDFKTTVGTWGQERANRERWQPTLYRWAAHEVFGYPNDDDDTDQRPFRFQYVVLNRRTLDVSIWEPQRNWANDWQECMTAGSFISKMVSDDSYPCVGGHGMCPECGERWDHGHVCNLAVLPPRIHISREVVA